MARRRSKKRVARRRFLLRWLGVGTLAFIAFLYWQPLRSYLSTRDAVKQQSSEVRQLRAQKLRLERRLTRFLVDRCVNNAYSGRRLLRQFKRQGLEDVKAGNAAQCPVGPLRSHWVSAARCASRFGFLRKPWPSSFASMYQTSPPAARTLAISCSASV